MPVIFISTVAIIVPSSGTDSAIALGANSKVYYKPASYQNWAELKIANPHGWFTQLAEGQASDRVEWGDSVIEVDQ